MNSATIKTKKNNFYVTTNFVFCVFKPLILIAFLILDFTLDINSKSKLVMFPMAGTHSTPRKVYKRFYTLLSLIHITIASDIKRIFLWFYKIDLVVSVLQYTKNISIFYARYNVKSMHRNYKLYHYHFHFDHWRVYYENAIVAYYSRLSFKMFSWQANWELLTAL